MKRNTADAKPLSEIQYLPSYVKEISKKHVDSVPQQASVTSKHSNLYLFIDNLRKAAHNNKAFIKKLAESAAQLVEEKDELGQTALMFSIAYNQLDCANSLLKAGARVDETDNSGQTALHVAINKGLSNCVKFLLSKGASWRQRDIKGVTALHLAAMHPLAKSLSLILKAIGPGEVDLQDSCKRTALHWSAAYANVDHIELLLGHGANICIPDKDGKTALHWAAASTERKAVDCLKALLGKKPTIVNWQDYEGRSALHLAVLSGTIQAIDHLVNNEHCCLNILDNKFYTPLHLAARQGFVCKMSLLLDRGADYRSVDINGATAMHYAAHYNHVEAVKALLSRSYVTDMPDFDGRTAFIWAAARRADELVDEMAKFDIDLNYASVSGCTAFHAAALNGHLSTVKLLMGLKASARAKDKAGMTPFLRACQNGKGKVVELLLQYNSYGFAKDKRRRMGIHWAAIGGYAYLCQLLVRYGYPYNVQDIYGMTPLHYATIKGHTNCVLVLLDSDANPNIGDKKGKTPLHWAASLNKWEIAKALYKYDAFINGIAMNKKRMTPLDSALQSESIIAAQFLRSESGLKSSEIKRLAAEKIQSWYMKKKIYRKRFHARQCKISVYSHWNENLGQQQCKIHERLAVGGQYNFSISDYSAVKLSSHLSDEDRAALVIQKAWHRFLIKKRMLNMRQNIMNTFMNVDEMRAAEEKWKQCLEMFFRQL